MEQILKVLWKNTKKKKTNKISCLGKREWKGIFIALVEF
jgi:hypothetical protein